MKRHAFLFFWALVGAVLLAAPGPGLAAQGGAATGGVLKGFIIADAHLGWDSPQQPCPDEQRQMLHRILKRFPDLDVLMDIGDAYHSVAPSCDEGRGRVDLPLTIDDNPLHALVVSGKLKPKPKQ